MCDTLPLSPESSPIILPAADLLCLPLPSKPYFLRLDCLDETEGLVSSLLSKIIRGLHAAAIDIPRGPITLAEASSRLIFTEPQPDLIFCKQTRNSMYLCLGASSFSSWSTSLLMLLSSLLLLLLLLLALRVVVEGTILVLQSSVCDNIIHILTDCLSFPPLANTTCFLGIALHFGKRFANAIDLYAAFHVAPPYDLDLGCATLPGAAAMLNRFETRDSQVVSSEAKSARLAGIALLVWVISARLGMSTH
mmetsp:Transcript_27654/g.55858  ORF Transcript_27654/g.55858 Transcript_27654/m.55858 type:complete len:250 (+) Transcript_27654:736-1485(+)